jgi:alpha-beta hydrolase superfamily lysophospholipase
MKIDKHCRMCKQTKPLSEFYFKGKVYGYSSRCKVCLRSVQNKWREKNPEYNKEYAADHRIRVDPALRPRFDAPEKVKARNTVAYAKKIGQLIPSPFCLLCWDVCTVEAHHQDYSNPLEVVWLCSPCHNVVDRGGYSN